MDKHFFYRLCIIGQLVSAVELEAKWVPLGFTSIGITSESCTGNDGKIQVQVQNSSPPIVYRATFPGRLPIENITGLFEGLSAGTYTIQAFKPSGTITASVLVQKQLPLTVRRISVANVEVPGEATGVIALETSGGLGKMSVEILPNSAEICVLEIGPEDFLIRISNLSAATYTIHLQSEDNCSPITLSVQVIEPERPAQFCKQ